MILSSRLVTLFILHQMLHLANAEIVCIAARCNHCYQKARAMCFDADVFNPLTFTEQMEREINNFISVFPLEYMVLPTLFML